MSVGALGNITFTVSENLLRTFNNFSRTSSIKIVEHQVMNQQKPILEYSGKELEAITFGIQLSVGGNLNPKTEISKLREIMYSGEAQAFILNNKIIGEKWIITQVAESNTVFGNSGEQLRADATLTLKEIRRDNDDI